MRQSRAAGELSLIEASGGTAGSVVRTDTRIYILGQYHVSVESGRFCMGKLESEVPDTTGTDCVLMPDPCELRQAAYMFDKKPRNSSHALQHEIGL